MNHKNMCEVPATVEQLFHEIKTLKFLSFSPQLMIGLSSVGKIYLVYGILENAKNCLYGNKVADLKHPITVHR